MSERWQKARQLLLNGTPAKAFDHATEGFPDESEPHDERTLADKLPALIRACPAEVFDTRRLDVLARIKPALWEGTVDAPTPKSLLGRVSFPVIEENDRFCDVLVDPCEGDSDQFPSNLDDDSRAAVGAALEAVRRAHGLTLRFRVLIMPETLQVSGASLGLATALAALSRVSRTPVRSRWSATGRVTGDGVVDDVGHIPAKVALAQSERPAGLLLVPASQTLDSEIVRGVATLAEAVELVFAPDLEEAEKGYVARLAEQTQRLDGWRLATAGVAREAIPSPRLLDVHVWPDATSEDWLRLARRIDGAAHDSDLLDEYKRLTGETYEKGHVPRRDIRTFRKSSKRLVVCGELGLGKSTLLRRFALEAASAHGSDERLPLLLDASEFSPREGDSDFAAFARRHTDERLGPSPSSTQLLAINTRLASGQVELFIDGLNELLLTSERHAFLKALGRYLVAHPAASLVLATRDWAYDVPLEVETTVVYLQPFSHKQAEAFWKANYPDRRDLRSVLALVPPGPDGQTLLLNPLLLMVAGLLNQVELQGLRHRVQFFERVVRKLISRQDDNDSTVEKRVAVWGKAVLSAREHGSDAAPRRRWTKWLVEAGADSDEAAAAEFSFAVESAGLLIKRLGDRFAPFHESVGEFLAAVWLTREPLDALGSRLRSLPQESSFHEIASQAVARTVLVLEEGDAAVDALRELLDAADPVAAAHALSLAVDAGDEGLPFPTAFEDDLLAGLAEHARVFADDHTARHFSHRAEGLWRQDNVRGRVKGRLLEALLALAEAPHPVRDSARIDALRLVSLVASANTRVRKLCLQMYEAGKTGDARGEVAVALLESEAMPLAGLVAGLGKALKEEQWHYRAGRFRARIGEILRRRLGCAAELRALPATNDESTTRTIELLTVLANPDDPGALRTLLNRLEKGSSDSELGVLAQVVAHSKPALQSLLAFASENYWHWFPQAIGELDAHALQSVVVPWLLNASDEVKQSVAQAWPTRERSEGLAAVLPSLCALARTGDAATALSAVEFLNKCSFEVRESEQVKAAVRDGVERLIPLVDESQAVRLWNVSGRNQGDPRQALLRRFIDSSSVLDALDADGGWTDEDLALFGERLKRAMVEENHALVLSLALKRKHRALTQLGQQALRRLVDTAPEPLAQEAAWVLAEHRQVDVALLRRLTRSLGTATPARVSHRGSLLIQLIQQHAPRDREIARSLIDMDMPTDDMRRWLLPKMIQADETLFELVLDAALDPSSERAQRGAHLVWSLVGNSEALKEQTEHRVEKSGAWGVMLGDVGDALYRRPFYERAMRKLLGDLDIERDGMPCALSAACKLAFNAELDPAVERVIRHYLPAENRAVALKAVVNLVEAGRDDEAIHEALRRILEGTPRQTLIASMLLHSLGETSDEMVRRLVELQASEVQLNALWLPWQCATRALARRHEREGIVTAGLLETKGNPEGRDALRPDFVRARTVGHAATYLLVEMERVEVVPTLLLWLESDKPSYRTAQFLDFLGQGAHPTFVAWRLKQVERHALGAAAPSLDSSSFEAFDALVKVIPDDRALMEAVSAGVERRGGPLHRQWGGRLVERAKASAAWSDWLGERLAHQSNALAAEVSTLLLTNGVVTRTLADVNVAVFEPLEPRVAALLPTEPMVRQAVLELFATGEPLHRVHIAQDLIQLPDSELLPDRLREKALEVLRLGTCDAAPDVRWESICALAKLGDEDEATAAGRVFLEDGDDSPIAMECRTRMAIDLLESGRERDAAVDWLLRLLAPGTAFDGDYLFKEAIDALMAAEEAQAEVAKALLCWLDSNPVTSLFFGEMLKHAQTLAQQGHVTLSAAYFLRRELEGLLLGAWWAEEKLPELRRHAPPDEHLGLNLPQGSIADRANALVRVLAKLGFDQEVLTNVLLRAAGASDDEIRAHAYAFVDGGWGEEARELALRLVARRSGDGAVEELARVWLWQGLALKAA